MKLIKGGLHLNDWGSGKLPMNFIKKLKLYLKIDVVVTVF